MAPLLFAGMLAPMAMASSPHAHMPVHMSGAVADDGADDFEEGEADEEEEEVQVMGGEGFTPDQLREAETEQMAALVGCTCLQLGCPACSQPCYMSWQPRDCLPCLIWPILQGLLARSRSLQLSRHRVRLLMLNSTVHVVVCVALS